MEFSPSNTLENIACKCITPPFNYLNYLECYLGMDDDDGRYGEVTMLKCIHCNRFWIRYQMEEEATSGSGKWYKGIVEEKNLYWLRQYNAFSYLKEIPWYIYGGSYFGSTGAIGMRGNIL